MTTIREFITLKRAFWLGGKVYSLRYLLQHDELVACVRELRT